MKTVHGVILILVALVVIGCTQKVNDPADVQAVKKCMDDYAKACNAGDSEGVAVLTTDKTIVALNNARVIVGKEAIKSAYGGYFSQFKAEFSASLDDVRVVGNLAVAKGSWSLKSIPRAQGIASFTDSGSWSVVFARQNDGSWKWDWLTENSNQPLPGFTASSADEQALFQLERDWAAASPKKDTAVVDQFLANEFVSSFNGRTLNKKQFLVEMKSNPAKIESAANSEMKAMMFGVTAVVHGLYIEKSTTNRKDTSQQLRFTEVYAKRDGRWQCVTQYLTKVQ